MARHHPDYKPLTLAWTGASQRRRIAAGRKQLLARAVGLHKTDSLSVLDATAGLGRDAFTLAALGATVTLVERQPLLAALLRDAWQRTATDPVWQKAAARMQIIEGDAAALLAGPARWDVVHLDPMYPHRGKQALPQKEMQLLRELCGHDDDAAELLDLALGACRRRVVVKRPLSAPFLAGHRPDFQLRGTQARYDVYIPPSSADR
ncbi:16S rRNA (guanine1516-N2)-methyltransferase [Fontimonas thermophila]|uniref:Ribosomal RNA small subunit methyltransferase J n=1 Tax=Fontimonas thermophila TaxID=1076937 RepID=A0A1I2HZD2_9GAMM|nr:16S rRNA (guanine1516-N2)-methyltransferase [Fontimonas thermophila]